QQLVEPIETVLVVGVVEGDERAALAASECGCWFCNEGEQNLAVGIDGAWACDVVIAFGEDERRGKTRLANKLDTFTGVPLGKQLVAAKAFEQITELQNEWNGSIGLAK